MPSSYVQLSWDPLSWCGRLSHSDAALEEDLVSQALEESSSFLCSERNRAFVNYQILELVVG
jgi:hypothetical protein